MRRACAERRDRVGMGAASLIAIHPSPLPFGPVGRSPQGASPGPQGVVTTPEYDISQIGFSRVVSHASKPAALAAARAAGLRPSDVRRVYTRFALCWAVGAMVSDPATSTPDAPGELHLLARDGSTVRASVRRGIDCGLHAARWVLRPSEDVDAGALDRAQIRARMDLAAGAEPARYVGGK